VFLQIEKSMFVTPVFYLGAVKKQVDYGTTAQQLQAY
jgi:hypothetical protein